MQQAKEFLNLKKKKKKKKKKTFTQLCTMDP
jgi:hypothetical protein